MVDLLCKGGSHLVQKSIRGILKHTKCVVSGNDKRRNYALTVFDS